MSVKIEIAKPVAKKLKVLFYGPSGSGKTLAGLTFPRVLMIDAESGSDLYAGRPGISEFHRVRCKTLSDVNEVLAAVESDKGKTWDTLVIDPVTVLYDVEKNVASANNTKDIEMRSWNKVNGRMTTLYNRLTSLDVHVVVIAREAIEYAGEGLNLKKVGVKPEADKKMVYMMDFIIHLKPDHTGEVEKSRGVELGKQGYLQKVNWEVFEPVASLYIQGDKLTYEDDDIAALKEANAWTTDNVTTWLAKWTAKKMNHQQLMEALGITGKWSNFKGTISQADALAEAYRNPIKTTENASPIIDDKPAQPKGKPAASPFGQSAHQWTDAEVEEIENYISTHWYDIKNSASMNSDSILKSLALPSWKATPDPKTAKGMIITYMMKNTIAIVADKAKFVKSGKGGYTALSNGDCVVRQYGRDAIRKLGGDWETYADSWDADQEYIFNEDEMPNLVVEWEAKSNDKGEFTYNNALLIMPELDSMLNDVSF